MQAFQNISAGSLVRFRIWNRATGRYTTVSGKVNPLLIFGCHVVVNRGPFGSVVDSANYVSHTPGKPIGSARVFP